MGSRRPRKRSRTEDDADKPLAPQKIYAGSIAPSGIDILPLEIRIEVRMHYCRLSDIALKYSASKIFKLLGPLELANLAQTNKSLRETLMNPSCDSYWDAACEREELIERIPLVPRILWIKTMLLPQACHVSTHNCSRVRLISSNLVEQRCGGLVHEGFRAYVLRTLCQLCNARQYVSRRSVSHGQPLTVRCTLA